MASPTPTNALLGGLAIPLAAHELLLLNGNVYGISGFLHRGIKGSLEGLAGVAGLVLGGVAIAALEGRGPANLSVDLPKVLLSGFLVGLGTKVRLGCVSISVTTLYSSPPPARKWMHVWVATISS